MFEYSKEAHEIPYDPTYGGIDDITEEELREMEEYEEWCRENDIECK
jgi:hypothetical protein